MSRRPPRDEDATIEAVRAAIVKHLTVPGTATPLEPYPEQIAGARSMLRGAVAEMATGEGKTIAAAFTAAVWARSGPVHVATANGYLAARDADLLRPVYAELGFTTGAVTPEMPPRTRRAHYRRDIVYSTLSELGFDYLRDRLVLRPLDRVQVRGLGSLIVDEADLLLIDEARTPLIIADPTDEPPEPLLIQLAPIIAALVQAQAQRVEQKRALLDGIAADSFDAAVLAAQLRRGAPRHPAVLDYFSRRPQAARNAEQAERELRGGHAATLEEGLLFRVDEQARTGYFTAEGQTVIEAQLGPLFERPDAPPEMLAALHNLLLAFALFERDHDYLVRDDAVVLIEPSTGRAAAGRRYMQGLHAAIETKELGAPGEHNQTRAQISVQQFARQYTRRAGMTGTAAPAAKELATIYGMETAVIPRHRPNRRVDLPARLFRTAEEADTAVTAAIIAAHRLGRPVLAGAQDLMRAERLSALLTQAEIPHTLLTARDHAREAEVIAGAGRFAAVTVATTMAGRGTDIRLEDNLDTLLVERAVTVVMQQAGSAVFDCLSNTARDLLAAGLRNAGVSVQAGGLRLVAGSGDAAAGGPQLFALGLEVIAAEPAMDRRLDDQLRGRSGRQGDDGITRLFGSLEDEVLRFHGAAGMRARALAALERHPFLEGRGAERVLADAQRRASRVHAGQRKRLFEFDQVLEAQRRAMLAGYEAVLTAPDPEPAIRAFIPEVAAGVASWQEAAALYGAATPEGIEAGQPPDRAVLSAIIEERYLRSRAEAGPAWGELARAALLRATTELRSVHVDRTEHLQRQAPAVYGFLPGPPEIPYAKEASALYQDYRWSVKAETIVTLTTLPQRYERALNPERVPVLSDPVRVLLASIERHAGDDQPDAEGA